MEDAKSADETPDKVEAVEYTFEEATQGLRDAYNSDEYNALHAIVAHKTYLQSMHKGRSETIYSALLAWIFENPEFSVGTENPIIKLLRLLAHKSILQQKENQAPLMDESFRNNVLTNAISVRTEVVETEVKTTGAKNGFLDLYVVATANSNNSNAEKVIRILLENKIDSKEHDEQCSKYYTHFCKDENKVVRFNNHEHITDIDIYVYLSIEEPKQPLSDEKEFGQSKFIRITYQEVYDNVLKPLSALSQRFSQSTNMYLKDFIDTMTTLNNSGKMQIVMAQETRELLKKFYENNQDLIDQAVLAGCTDPEVREAVENKQRRGAILYNVTHSQLAEPILVNQNNLLEEIIKAYVSMNHSFADSIQPFIDMGVKPTSIYKAANDTKKGYGSPVDFGGVSYRISTQLARKSNSFESVCNGAQTMGFEITEVRDSESQE